MGMAKLNVWVSGTDDPCSISDRTWYVTIFNCDGEVLQWCGKKYVVLPAKCGHLEVEVPPGCYYIKAVWSFWLSLGPKIIYRVNHFTDAAVVQACCDHHVCVTLFNPSIHRCGQIIVRAMKDLVRQKAVKEQHATQVENAIATALENIEKPKKAFELALHDDEIIKLVQAHEGKK